MVRLRSIPFALALALAAGASAAQSLGAAREAALANLVRHDCGSCHGLALTGGLGPALTPAALSGKPASVLETVILEGRPGTAMPGWRGLLSEAEAAWIAKRLLRGLPEPGASAREAGGEALPRARAEAAE
jgi:cytochrome c55X